MYVKTYAYKHRSSAGYCPDCQRKRESKRASRKWADRTIQQRLFNGAKKRAKQSGLPFTITVEDIVIPEACPYLECPLIFDGTKRNPRSASLDRIESSLGYVPGNVQVISEKANRMKNNATISELLTFAHNSIRRHSK